jgi:hypothetical protein
MAKGRVRLARFVTMLCLVVGFVVKINADEPSMEDNRAELVTAAKEAYEANESNFKQNKVVLDDVYVWSRRLMEAEKLQGTNSNAAADHTKRMRDLNEYVVLELPKRYPQRPVLLLHLQMKYFLLEAEREQAIK